MSEQTYVYVLEERLFTGKWKKHGVSLNPLDGIAWTSAVDYGCDPENDGARQRASECRMSRAVECIDPATLEVGKTYRARRPRRISNHLHPNYGKYPDRTLVYVGYCTVTYDGPAVKIGSHYPKMTKAEFLLWAGSEVTGDEDE